MSMFEYKAAALSDAGAVKTVNQDSYCLKMGSYNREYFIMAIVADGMGGVKEGEIASRSLAAAFSNWFHSQLKGILEKSDKEGEPLEDLLISDWENIVEEICMELYEYSKSQDYKEGDGPGSTLSGVFLYGGTYYAINIGDSRVYRMNERLKQITKDHSWAQMAKEQGLTDEEIAADSRSNKVAKCIGGGFNRVPEADYFAGSYQPGDYFLLCTDGLRRVLESKDIEFILKAKDGNTREKCEVAVDLAKENGETDNITAIIIETGRNSEETKIPMSVSESTYLKSNGYITEELKVGSGKEDENGEEEC